MDINLTTPNLENVLTKGNTNGDIDITSTDGKAVLSATTSGASLSFNNGGVGEYANVQMDAVSVSIEHNALINITAPQVTVDGAQTVTGQEDAQSFKITGTNGDGKEMFRHQSINSTSTGQHTALFAGSDGELYQKNDGNAVTKIATAADLSSYETSSHASSTYQPILTSANFGTFVNGLSAKATPIDADFLSVNDTADSNKEKKTTFLQAWTNYFKGKADAVYTTTSAVASQITTALSGYLTSATAASTYEPIITKGTAFNKNFGTSSGDILLQTGTTANQILVTDANNKVTSQAKGTAFNRNFGVSSGDILLSAGTTASKMLITNNSNQVTTSSFSSGDLVFLDQPQTLTNKTLSGSSNTFSSIPKSAIIGYEGYSLNGATIRAATSPADGVTYFFGASNSNLTIFTASGRVQIFMPKAGTITYVRCTFDQTIGSAETSTLSLRLNNTTDTIISSSVVNNTTSTSYTAAVSIAVAVDDYVEFKWVTPTWVTNPTNVGASWIIYIE